MQENKNISAYRQQLRDRILDTAMHAFATQGIRAVKMDDIARQLGISKRTLYEIYDNKEDLLFEGVKKYKEIRERQIKDMLDGDHNVMDVILYAYRQKVETFRRTSPKFYSDLTKFPRVMSLQERDRHVNHERFLVFLERGVKEGFFRTDIDYRLVVRLFEAIGDYILNNQLYRIFSIEAIFKNIVFVSIRGFCTERGIKTIDAMIDCPPPTL
ncbi:MAG: TetR/AcrR family transcriptional regulator [Prevotella sp.]|nr:TetR/AcrR family transcriptional regulator [Prevotella sp.]